MALFVRINYPLIKAECAQIKRIAAQLEKTSQSALKELQGDSPAVWKGLSGDRYRARVSEYYNTLTKTARDIASIAQAIDGIGWQVHLTDLLQAKQAGG